MDLRRQRLRLLLCLARGGQIPLALVQACSRAQELAQLDPVSHFMQELATLFERAARLGQPAEIEMEPAQIAENDSLRAGLPALFVDLESLSEHRVRLLHLALVAQQAPEVGEHRALHATVAGLPMGLE